jgi:hypothetical protein
MAGAEADAVTDCVVLADMPGPFELVSVRKINAPRAHRVMVRNQTTQALSARIDFSGAQTEDLLASIKAQESACVQSFAAELVHTGQAVEHWRGRAKAWLEQQQQARKSLRRLSSKKKTSEAQKTQRAEALEVANENGSWAGAHEEAMLKVCC